MVPMETRRGYKIPGTGATGGCELPNRGARNQIGPLQEQQAL